MLAALLAGCGQATHSATHATTDAARHATVCQPKASSAIAQFLGVPAGTITAGASTGNNSMPQCTFATRPGSAVAVRITANIDTAPQPYFRLERTAEEAEQEFSTVRLAMPQDITGLGLDADWYPGQQQLMTTDGTRLITVSVSWRKASHGRRQAIAEDVARTYLGRLNPDAT